MIHIKDTQNARDLKWIHLLQPSNEEIDQLMDEYNISRDFLTAVRDPYEVAREEYVTDPDGSQPKLIVIEYIQPGENIYHKTEFSTHPFSIIIMDNVLITVSMDIPYFLETFYDTYFWNSISGVDAKEIALRILWNTESFCVKTLKDIFSEITELQKDIVKSSKNKELFKLMTLERSLTAIKTTITNNQTIIKKLLDSSEFINESIHQEMLHDVYVESLQAESMVHEALLITDRLSDIISNVISNNLNNIMKVLTSITIILTIPTIISGMWGMNVPVPWQDSGNGFIYTILISLVVMIVTIWWLKKQDFM